MDPRRAIAAEELTKRNPEIPNYWRSLAVHVSNMWDLYHTSGRPAESRAEYERALAIAEDLVARQPDIVDYRNLRALYRSSLVFLLRATGRFPESAAAFDQVIAELDALVRGQCAGSCRHAQDGNRALQRRVLYSLAIAGVRDSTSAAAERDALVKALSELAVGQVGKAIAAGYRSVNLIRNNPDLSPIRDREDFRKLVEQLENEPKAKSNPQGK